MTVKIDGTNGVDTAQLRPADGDPVAITIAADGKVAFPQYPTLPPRTWQAFTSPGQRALGTIYTNDTGQDLIVRVRLSLPGVTTNLQCAINGVTMFGGTILTSAAGADQWTVPDGATYQPGLSAGTTGTVTWHEFRTAP